MATNPSTKSAAMPRAKQSWPTDDGPSSAPAPEGLRRRGQRRGEGDDRERRVLVGQRRVRQVPPEGEGIGAVQRHVRLPPIAGQPDARSEERRVGKEGRS